MVIHLAVIFITVLLKIGNPIIYIVWILKLKLPICRVN